jgi:hypothetical protein
VEGRLAVKPFFFFFLLLPSSSTSSPAKGDNLCMLTAFAQCLWNWRPTWNPFQLEVLLLMY